MGYQSAADDVSPKFTGQDRDQETADDWFQVRYMDGAQGRFQSVDPGNAGANLGDPQTWNGYSYVGNNPLSYTDPSGMFTCVSCVADESGNPVVIGIAAAIDIGAAITGLVEGILGGGGPPATISPGLATPSNPVLGNGQAGSGNSSSSFCSGSNPLVLCATGSGGATASGGPDFVTLNGSVGFPWVGWSPAISRDRYGRWYVSVGGLTVGKSLTIVSGSLTANYLNKYIHTHNSPTPAELSSFMTGHAFSLSGGFGFGVSETCSPGGDCATGVGAFTPLIGGAYNYTPVPSRRQRVERRHPRPLFLGIQPR